MCLHRTLKSRSFPTVLQINSFMCDLPSFDVDYITLFGNSFKCFSSKLSISLCFLQKVKVMVYCFVSEIIY